MKFIEIKKNCNYSDLFNGREEKDSALHQVLKLTEYA